MKIIPAIDLIEGKVVRLYKGDPDKKTIYSDNPLDIAKKWEAAGADMLHLVDLDATLGIGSNFEVIRNVAKSVKIPVKTRPAPSADIPRPSATDSPSHCPQWTEGENGRRF